LWLSEEEIDPRLRPRPGGLEHDLYGATRTFVELRRSGAQGFPAGLERQIEKLHTAFALYDDRFAATGSRAGGGID
jgi:hypothetical protein